ncbi:hypothetical protein [Streptosporangium roseum]|uniref:hypothetical protein n=1 Tax=Streptosporangium roseum TaxID=2001 RepID=UPI0012DE8339|nr:hypothetical protein [Streptosporangium roseum]
MREIHMPPAWADAGELPAEVPERFRLDSTAGQAAALYVCAEKSTLQALFSSWLGVLGVPVAITSTTARTDLRCSPWWSRSTWSRPTPSAAFWTRWST